MGAGSGRPALRAWRWPGRRVGRPAAGRAARRTRRGTGAGDGDGSEAGGASESVVGGRRAGAQLRWCVCVCVCVKHRSRSCVPRTAWCGAQALTGLSAVRRPRRCVPTAPRFRRRCISNPPDVQTRAQVMDSDNVQHLESETFRTGLRKMVSPNTDRLEPPERWSGRFNRPRPGRIRRTRAARAPVAIYIKTL